MEGYQISPDHPPFPMPMNLPFQPDMGIQTSNLMSESCVGLISPATRQNAGRLSKGDPEKSMGFGIVKVPAGSDFAKVIVVSGRTSVARLSHVVARADGTPTEVPAKRIINGATHKGMAGVFAGRRALIAAPQSAECIKKSLVACLHVEIVGQPQN